MLLLLHKNVPESPRWQASVGKQRLACETLQKVALVNNTEWTLGEYTQLKVTTTKTNDASFFDLFTDGYAKLTIVLWCLWLTITLLYYSVILLATQVFES